MGESEEFCFSYAEFEILKWEVGEGGSDCRGKEMNKEIINQTYYISVSSICIQ